MESRDFIFTSDDGTPLCATNWIPDGGPRAMVHILHGLAEHSARYDRTARTLAARGYLVFAHDHRGHGRTAGSPERLGGFALRDGWNRALKDITLLLEAERKDYPALPMILLGHSMGSFMAQNMMFAHPELLDACALSGPGGKPDFRVLILRAMAHIECLRIGRHARSTLMYNFSLASANKAFRPVRTRFDWLSRDTAEVDRFVADPMCGWIGPPQLWLDMLHGALEGARPENKERIPRDLPLYVFAGTKDPVSGGRGGLDHLIDSYRRAGLRDVRFRFYPEGRHEMLNEINRDEVVSDILLWLEDVSRKKRT